MTRTDGYRAPYPTHAGYGMPRGPLGDYRDARRTLAIGFCPRCESNARGTCSNRGLFDCPTCTYVWYDARVGTVTLTFDDFFSGP